MTKGIFSQGQCDYVKNLIELSNNSTDSNVTSTYLIKLGSAATVTVTVKEEAKEMIKMINNILIEVLETMAEAERDKIKSRQSSGIALMPVDKNGKRLSLRPGKGAVGSPSVEYPDTWKEASSNWTSGEITAVKAMELTTLKKNTFYNLVEKYEEKYEEKDSNKLQNFMSSIGDLVGVGLLIEILKVKFGLD